MALIIPWQSVRLGLGVAIVLSAGVMLAPRQVQASCGDYVVMQGRIGHTAHLTSPASPPAARPDLPPVKEPAPCTGPTCSRSKPLPLPITASPPAPLSAEHWGWVAELGDGPDPAGRDSILEDISARPIRRSAGVFHPPR